MRRIRNLCYWSFFLLILVASCSSNELTINVEAAERWNIQFPLELIETSTLYGADRTIANE
jgi:hypothetical protein